MSEDQTFRAKTFLNVSKLMNNIEVPEEATHIRVTFDNVLSGGGNYKSSKSIRVLSVKAIKDRTVLKEYDMMDIFKIAEGINVWLNVGRQLNKYPLSMTGMLSKIEIDLKQKTFIDNTGREVKYNPLSCQQFKNGESLMNKLSEALKEKEQQYYHLIAENSTEAYVQDDVELNEDLI